MHLRKASIIRLGISLLALAVVLGAAITTGMYLSASHAASTPTTISQAASAVWSVTRGVQRDKQNFLTDIAARTASDVWAVGSSASSSSSSASHTLIEHWNGKQWSIVKSPDAPASVGPNNALIAVVAISATNAWAAGASSTNQDRFALMEHWNGNQWSLVTLPSQTADGISFIDGLLFDIAASSADDVWAVGDARTSDGTHHGLVEHWNGNQWTAALVVDPNTELHGITILAPNNIWMAGRTTFIGGGGGTPLALHGDGKTFKAVPTDPTVLNGVFAAVTAVSANNIWAVGGQVTPANNVVPLIEHWNGTSWKVSSVPATPGTFTNLSGITALTANNIWAVGASTSNTASRTLILHWDGKKWTPLPGPVSASNCGLARASSAAGVTWATGTCVRTNTTDTIDALLIRHP